MITKSSIVKLLIIMIYLVPIITIQNNALGQNPSLSDNNSITVSLAPSSSNNKIFYIFTAEHEGVNETKLGIPADAYSPDVLIVNEGDNVTIKFYNLDPLDRHTFTMTSPYNITKDLPPGSNTTFSFNASTEGVFKFYCLYHLPTMSGQLVVLHPPTIENNRVTVAK